MMTGGSVCNSAASRPVCNSAANAPVETPPPTYDQLISWQSSAGNWQESLESKFKQFISNGSLKDQNFEKKFPEIKGTIFLTLLALYIIEELFSHMEAESEMIVRKAKMYLIQNGVEKPDNIIKQFNLELKVDLS